MNRNVESHFALNPTDIKLRRSRFDRSFDIKTTFNVGDVIPFYCDEVLPGDTFDVSTSKIVRLQTLLRPIMDNIYLDTYYFFVPNRLVWQHWQEFCGENNQSAWIPKTEYSIPQLKAPTGGWNVGTLADYFSIPTGIEGLSVNALPFRAYALIMDQWFRDENLTDPLLIPDGDAESQGVNTGNYINDTALGGLPFKAAKYHDYFTSCLPSPQKGPDVSIPISDFSGNFPVVPLEDTVDSSLITNHYSAITIDNPTVPSGTGYMDGSIGFQANNLTPGSFVGKDVVFPQVINDNGSPNVNSTMPIINNLWAVNTGMAQAATINDLRNAFAVQKLYEKDARGGTRYIEVIKSHFGVTSPDARLQRAEYLGGNRIPITISEVVQQSGTPTSEGTPLGNLAAMSKTADTHSDFIKSFVEHGYVIGVMVARYDHTYQQGLRRLFSRKDRFDFYWPVFANLGEQAVLNKEIYAQGTADDDKVFGYQEAWADYRYHPSVCTGEMRSTYSETLDSWHLGDKYESLPTLSDSWIREDGTVVDRTLAVSSRLSDQIMADIYVRNYATRPMPMYSIPGLLNHA